ncbi:hypothetical protein KPL47_23870 [Clostridium estertheticum]|uniref:hypothetical protein n=1 Tax=Clostridium estertheticum TaxID=238834 RepID=UPI001C0BB2F8|nr:hypothetical protein [Clostridium estertheticum]MBU3179330.1 hypothetical protein [Clostridium estertheticum]
MISKYKKINVRGILLEIAVVFTIGALGIALNTSKVIPNNNIVEASTLTKETKESKEISKEKIAIINQKTEQLKSLEIQNKKINQSNTAKWCIVIKTMKAHPENFNIAKQKSITVQSDIITDQITKLILFNQASGYDINIDHTLNLPTHETITYLDKMIGITSYRNKEMKNIEKQMDILSSLL